MTTLLVAIVVTGICVFGMFFNIVFRKKDFPDYEVSKNKEMRRIGIKCLHEQEQEARSAKRDEGKPSSCPGTYSDTCVGCGLYPHDKKTN